MQLQNYEEFDFNKALEEDEEYPDWSMHLPKSALPDLYEWQVKKNGYKDFKWRKLALQFRERINKFHEQYVQLSDLSKQQLFVQNIIKHPINTFEPILFLDLDNTAIPTAKINEIKRKYGLSSFKRTMEWIATSYVEYNKYISDGTMRNVSIYYADKQTLQEEYNLFRLIQKCLIVISKLIDNFRIKYGRKTKIVFVSLGDWAWITHVFTDIPDSFKHNLNADELNSVSWWFNKKIKNIQNKRHLRFNRQAVAYAGSLCNGIQVISARDYKKNYYVTYDDMKKKSLLKYGESKKCFSMIKASAFEQYLEINLLKTCGRRKAIPFIVCIGDSMCEMNGIEIALYRLYEKGFYIRKVYIKSNNRNLNIKTFGDNINKLKNLTNWICPDKSTIIKSIICQINGCSEIVEMKEI